MATLVGMALVVASVGAQLAAPNVLLYRAIVLKDDPRRAYDAVEKVWVPDGAWRSFIERQLRKHRIDFELL
jgi:hypothetical protein